MITLFNRSFVRTTAAAGAWAVDLSWYTGSLCLLFAQTVGGLWLCWASVVMCLLLKRLT